MCHAEEDMIHLHFSLRLVVCFLNIASIELFICYGGIKLEAIASSSLANISLKILKLWNVSCLVRLISRSGQKERLRFSFSSGVIKADENLRTKLTCS